MATNVEIQIIKRETVKPSSPTPDNFRRYKLSFLDQIFPTDPIPPLLLFYLGNTHLTSVSKRSQLLTKSLSKTLTRFYHFAGRLRDNIAIDCNDEGAEFVATKVNRPLSEFLTNPDFATLKEFIPAQTFPKEELSRSPLLQVKVNFFNCGGLAMGVSLSHKVADASTLTMFLTSWANAAKSDIIIPAELVYSASSIFPPLECLSSFPDRYQFPYANEKTKLKRLVFHRNQIEALWSKSGTNSTRVEAVSALIWKCAIEALSGSECNSSFFQAVDIRKRMNPSLPENSVGNLVWCFEAKIQISIGAEIHDLVALLRKGIEEFEKIWREGVPTEAILGSVEEEDKGIVHRLVASSWCRFPLYCVDFGWGKPVWICMPNTISVKNAFVMMDTKDGEGIEVSLVLDEEEMKRFQTNPELLAFASLDPAIIV